MLCTVYPDNSKKSRQSKFLAWQVSKSTFVNLWPAYMYTLLPCVIQCIYWRENWQMNWSFFSTDNEVISSMHSIVSFTCFTSITRLNTKCTWGSSIPCCSCKHHNLTHNYSFLPDRLVNLVTFVYSSVTVNSPIVLRKRGKQCGGDCMIILHCQ